MSETRTLTGRCGGCGSRMQVQAGADRKTVACPKCNAPVTLVTVRPSDPNRYAFACPNCDGMIEVAREAIGQAVTCGECAQEVHVPPPADPVVQPKRTRRIDVGPKNECPACGGRKVRAMSFDETKQRYGNVFTLSAPRLCKDCGHGYEAYPSAGGCYAMMVFSALGVVFGAVLVLAAVALPFLLLAAVSSGEPNTSGRPIPYYLVMAVVGGATGAGFMLVGYRTFAKYAGYLSVAGGPADGPNSG